MPRLLSRHHVFGKAFNDLPGALSSSASTLPVLTLRQKDDTYLYQQSDPKPWLLDRKVLHLAMLLDTEHHSRQVFEQLVSMSLLSPEGEVDTRAAAQPGFGGKIMSKLAFIPQIKIRMVIDFLFWWEEETARLKKLFDHKHHLESLITRGMITNDSSADVKATLRQIDARIATIPSRRDEAVEAGLLEPAAQPVIIDASDPPPYSRYST